MVGLIDLVQTLTSPHPLDRYLELVRPTLTLRDMRAEITHVRHSASDSVTLTLRPTWQWTGHRAGQYVQVGVLIDGVKHTRCYSPVSAQSRRGRKLQLTVKAHSHGLVSRYLYRHAAPGMVVDLAPADGSFALPDARPDRILLLSGGSGITPVLSMLRTLARENYSGTVAFLHYAKHPEAVPHREELADLAERHDNFHIELRYPSRGDGHFDVDTLERVAPWYADAETFVCGPAALMDSARRIYEAEGLGDRLHSEEFTLPTTPVDPADVTGATTFSASGVRAENAGASLLEQAEKAGLTPESGCRMGICFSCTAVRRSGCTRNLRTGELDSDPDQPIQLCINAAVGDVDIEI
ncbi:ferredoxin reductase [Nocardia blacklockiae]|uniref:ferredoxin reductase n=1 Tax=Nocardia blacklockiae TaxID=480036 RepID=UPI001893488F|nr:FAD-binding oxidoreductase [Nocardia blacklockiae]MBF6172006.1 ferredoxin reductase [Nocardia blacklockiae]